MQEKLARTGNPRAIILPDKGRVMALSLPDRQTPREVIMGMFADGSMGRLFHLLCVGERVSTQGMSEPQKEAALFLGSLTWMEGVRCPVSYKNKGRKGSVQCSGRLQGCRLNYSMAAGIPAKLFVTGSCNYCRAISFSEMMEFPFTEGSAVE